MLSRQRQGCHSSFYKSVKCKNDIETISFKELHGVALMARVKYLETALKLHYPYKINFKDASIALCQSHNSGEPR